MIEEVDRVFDNAVADVAVVPEIFVKLKYFEWTFLVSVVQHKKHSNLNQSGIFQTYRKYPITELENETGLSFC